MCAHVHKQVSVGDGWAPYIVRPLAGIAEPAAAGVDSLAGNVSGNTGAPAMNRWVALFFVSFFFASGICLLGVMLNLTRSTEFKHADQLCFRPNP